MNHPRTLLLFVASISIAGPLFSVGTLPAAQEPRRQQRNNSFPSDRYLLYLSIGHSWNETANHTDSTLEELRSPISPGFTELSWPLEGTIPTLLFFRRVSMQIPQAEEPASRANEQENGTETMENGREKKRRERSRWKRQRVKQRTGNREQTAGNRGEKRGEERGGNRLATGVNSHGSGRRPQRRRRPTTTTTTTTSTPCPFFSTLLRRAPVMQIRGALREAAVPRIVLPTRTANIHAEKRSTGTRAELCWIV